MRCTLTFILGTAIVGLFAARPAAAQDLKVTVVAILVTDKNQTIDPKLAGIAAEIQKREPTLTGFRIERTTCKTVTLAEKESFKLIDDTTADVTVIQKDDEKTKIKMTVKAPLLGEITYTTCCNKYFPIMTRYVTEKEKERLIVAVMVKPVEEKK